MKHIQLVVISHLIILLLAFGSFISAQSFKTLTDKKPSELFDSKTIVSHKAASQDDSDHFARLLSIASYNNNFNKLSNEIDQGLYKKIKESPNKFNYRLGIGKVQLYGAPPTRQINDASRLFNISAPGVVLLVNLNLSSMGSGVIINKEGEILTNWHVAKGSDKMIVYLYHEDIASIPDLEDHDYYIANVVGLDSKRDLALLRFEKVEEITFKHLKFAPGYKIDIGDEVFAIGHPQNVMWSFAADYISRVRKNYKWTYGEHELSSKVIQTQVPINPGNSGGPMFNKMGQIVGINSFGMMESQGLNFAVHVDEVTDFIDGVKKGDFKPNFEKQDIAEDWREYDTNNNGIIDAISLFKDGILWVQKDEDEDGTIDFWMFDTNDDDAFDIFTFDKNGDGSFEFFVVDKDFDGVPDTIRIDTNGDLVPDLDLVYSDELLMN